MNTDYEIEIHPRPSGVIRDEIVSITKELSSRWFKPNVPTIAFIVLLLTACGITFQPTPTIPSTDQIILSTKSAESLAAPTPSPSTIWSIYHNNQYGFTFEYPTVYDEASYKDSCGLKENRDGIHLGHQIDIFFMESNGLNLTGYANSLIKNKGWTSDSVKNVTINGLEAVTAEYRFGGTNRFGTFTLIEHNMHIFALNFSAGSFCDLPEAQVFEPEVYSHILETFQLAP